MTEVTIPIVFVGVVIGWIIRDIVGSITVAYHARQHKKAMQMFLDHEQSTKKKGR